MTEMIHRREPNAQTAHENLTSGSVFPLQAAFPPSLQLLADDAPASGSAAQSLDSAPPIQGSMLRPPVSSPGKAPIQRTISYKTSQYNNQSELVKALQALFPERTHADIAQIIQATEDQGGRAQTPNYVFQQVVQMVEKKYGVRADYSVTGASSDSLHGPMLPDRDTRDSKPDHDRATSTFNFGSVTLGQLTLMDLGGRRRAFVDRSQSPDWHAEDGLIAQVRHFFDQNRKVRPSEIAVNLTINNFFCSFRTTGKSNPFHNCLDHIIQLQKDFGFRKFHVYFKNPYGDRSLMEAQVLQLQKAGIKVSGFTNESGVAAPSGAYLDPSSDSESESDDEDFEMKHGPSSKDSFAEMRPQAPEVQIGMATYRFSADEVANDGDCFFTSLGRLDANNGNSVQELRTMAAENDWATYRIANMGTWADQEDIEYLAGRLGLTIHIHQFDLANRPIGDETLGNGSTHIYLAQINYGHFTPLRRK